MKFIVQPEAPSQFKCRKLEDYQRVHQIKRFIDYINERLEENKKKEELEDEFVDLKTYFREIDGEVFKFKERDFELVQKYLSEKEMIDLIKMDETARNLMLEEVTYEENYYLKFTTKFLAVKNNPYCATKMLYTISPSKNFNGDDVKPEKYRHMIIDNKSTKDDENAMLVIARTNLDLLESFAFRYPYEISDRVLIELKDHPNFIRMFSRKLDLLKKDKREEMMNGWILENLEKNPNSAIFITKRMFDNKKIKEHLQKNCIDIYNKLENRYYGKSVKYSDEELVKRLERYPDEAYDLPDEVAKRIFRDLVHVSSYSVEIAKRFPELVTVDNAKFMVTKGTLGLSAIPKELQTKELVKAAIEHNYKNFYYFSEQFIDEDEFHDAFIDKLVQEGK